MKSSVPQFTEHYRYTFKGRSLIYCSFFLPFHVKGMSEITGPGLTTIIEPGKFRLGSVGRPYEGLEIKLDYSASPEEGQGEVSTCVINDTTLIIDIKERCTCTICTGVSLNFISMGRRKKICT